MSKNCSKCGRSFPAKPVKKFKYLNVFWDSGLHSPWFDSLSEALSFSPMNRRVHILQVEWNSEKVKILKTYQSPVTDRTILK